MMCDDLEFKSRLIKLLNEFSIGNDSETPEYILSDYLVGCLQTYARTAEKVTAWEIECEDANR